MEERGEEILGMTHGVDKMDTEANSQEGKTGNLKRGGPGLVRAGVEKIMFLDLG